MEALKGLRTPTWYASNLAKHVKKEKLVGLKSHDLHCLLQHIIHALIRSSLPPVQRTSIIRLGKCLFRICAKVIVKDDLPTLQDYVVETMCILEVSMPPSFFDLMEHSLVHLVDQISMCGHVSCRWLYPLERYLGILKRYVCNKGRPEGSMASCYSTMEALGFCDEYLRGNEEARRRVWESKEDLRVSSIKISIRHINC